MLLFFLLGCQGECPALEQLTSAQASFTLNSEPFTGEASWMLTGTAMQVNITATDGTSITLRLQNSDESIAAADLIDSDLPASFSLGIPEKATGTVYPDGGTGNSATTSEDQPGSLTVYTLEPEVRACFSFQATDNDGTAHSINQGGFTATQLDL